MKKKEVACPKSEPGVKAGHAEHLGPDLELPCSMATHQPLAALQVEVVLLRKESFDYGQEHQAKGHLGGSVVEHLPLAWVMIPGSWDQVWHCVPHREPASPSAFIYLCLSQYVSHE